MDLTKIVIILSCILCVGCNSKLTDEVDQAYQELPEVVDFNFHIRPILSDRCFHCHGPDEKVRKANLRLDAESGIFSKLKNKEKYPIVPGKPFKSEAINRILSSDTEMVMPPVDAQLELTPREKALLVKWVEQGATWKDHWAFIAPDKAETPLVKNKKWPKNEIDYFVLKNLEGLELEPSEEASKEVLIRRLSFDLIGLPPTTEEIEHFVNDTSSDAYEKLVDRLLSSPQYGERWAWEWLDVARYADTNGFQGDFSRDMWPWRDWVINAFNNNMSYDEFTVKQLAGDLLPNATKDDILATAFNRNHPYNTEGGTIPEETRVVNVFDRLETTGTAWLGLTLECARCHDHKFDDISQKEYFQLFDYFNQTTEEGGAWSEKIRPLLNLGAPLKVKEVEQLQAYIDNLYDEVDEVELKIFPRDEGEPTSESDEVKKLKGLDNYLVSAPANIRAIYIYDRLFNYFKTKKSSKDYIELLKKVRDEKKKLEKLSSNIVQVMVMDTVDKPRQAYVLNRGGYDTPDLEQPVSMNVPAALPELPKNIKNNRLALAKWLVSKEQPLTSRVTVNRYWQAFFGNGIVKTIDDFGVQGELPTHPKLLDWLSRDFQDNNWDLKKFFKKIVMSATYRQSSKVSKELLDVDPENRLLARATRMRLPSWMLRDQALHASELLVDSIGGIPVKPYQPEGIWAEASFGKIKYDQSHGDRLYRRTLYSFWRRIVGPTMLFDNSTRHKTAVKTLRTNTPLHALNTLNDITYMESARVLAEKAIITKSSEEGRLQFLFKRITSRNPNAKELEIFQNRLLQLKQDFLGDKDEAKKIATAGEYAVNEDIDITELASYAVVTSVILNLDETITRQ